MISVADPFVLKGEVDQQQHRVAVEKQLTSSATSFSTDAYTAWYSSSSSFCAFAFSGSAAAAAAFFSASLQNQRVTHQ